MSVIALCANPNSRDAWKHPARAPHWLPFNSPELAAAFAKFDKRAAKEARSRKIMSSTRRISIPKVTQ